MTWGRMLPVVAFGAVVVALVVPNEAPVTKQILAIEDMFDRTVVVTASRPYAETVTVPAPLAGRLSSLVVLIEGPEGAEVRAGFEGVAATLVLGEPGDNRLVVPLRGAHAGSGVITIETREEEPLRLHAWFLKSRQPPAESFVDAGRRDAASAAGVIVAGVAILVCLWWTVRRSADLLAQPSEESDGESRVRHA